MKKMIPLLLVLSSSAFAAQPCDKGAKINQEFFDNNKIQILLNQNIPLSGTRLTFIGEKTGWKTYWGTVVKFIIHQTDGAKELSMAEPLPVDRGWYSEGDFSSSNMAVMTLERNQGPVNSIEVYWQPFSNLTVRRLEKNLNVTLICEQK